MRRLVVLAGALALLLPGCARHQAGLQVTGSDTMVNLAQAWAGDYMKRNPEASVSVTGGGSGVGIAALISGTTDIADASRSIEPAEVEEARKNGITPVEHIVAYDGITVVVNRQNPVTRLTTPQLAGIYTAQITNWRQVGGPDLPIVALARDRNSGTHVFFLEHVIRQGQESTVDYAPSDLLLPSNQAIADEVASNPKAIGYIGLGYYQPGKMRDVAIAPTPQGPFVLPSIATVQDRSYPIARPLYMYTRQDPRPEVADFLAYVTSPEGQAIVRRLDFVPLR